jgi:hypothetical protein
MKEIQLTQGFVALVDDSDYAWASQFCWHAAVRGTQVYAGRNGGFLMHRELLPGAKIVDHVNGNTLDNRRENLRSATRSQNAANSRHWLGKPTRGIRELPSGRFGAYITIQGRQKHLGVFDSKEQAAEARDAAAKAAFGEFARLNSEAR